jgi:hypothetical protein
MIIPLLKKHQHHDECMVRMRDYLSEFKVKGREMVELSRLMKKSGFNSIFIRLK